MFGWLKRRIIANEMKKFSQNNEDELFSQLTKELRNTSGQYTKIMRDAEKMLQVQEAQRRIQNIKSLLYEPTEDDSDDYDDADDDNSGEVINKLADAFLQGKFNNNRGAPTTQDPLMQNNVLGSDLQLTDEQIELAKKFLSKK